ncbi:hypothetical protein KHA80_14350 [Anaerobacillus sp. HL2]|nr:hypothetical protein KHA80_14350 [Anaerobacillus sp. HL2]
MMIYKPTSMHSSSQDGSSPSEPMNAEDIVKKAMEDERKRTMEITNLCRSFGYDPQEYIAGGKSMDEVRALFLKSKLKKRNLLLLALSKMKGTNSKDAARDGLALRIGLNVEKPAEGAKELRNMSLKELAVETLRLEGVANYSRLSADEILRQYMTPTSLFTGIMDQTARIVFEKAYTEAETTYQLWDKTRHIKRLPPNENIPSRNSRRIERRLAKTAS